MHFDYRETCIFHWPLPLQLHIYQLNSLAEQNGKAPQELRQPVTNFSSNVFTRDTLYSGTMIWQEAAAPSKLGTQTSFAIAYRARGHTYTEKSSVGRSIARWFMNRGCTGEKNRLPMDFLCVCCWRCMRARGRMAGWKTKISIERKNATHLKNQSPAMARFDLVVFRFDAVRPAAAAVVTAGGAAAVGRIVGTHFDSPISVPWFSFAYDRKRVLREPPDSPTRGNNRPSLLHLSVMAKAKDTILFRYQDFQYSSKNNKATPSPIIHAHSVLSFQPIAKIFFHYKITAASLLPLPLISSEKKPLCFFFLLLLSSIGKLFFLQNKMHTFHRKNSTFSHRLLFNTRSGPADNNLGIITIRSFHSRSWFLFHIQRRRTAATMMADVKEKIQLPPIRFYYATFRRQPQETGFIKVRSTHAAHGQTHQHKHSFDSSLNTAMTVCSIIIRHRHHQHQCIL